ncbi:MAG: hypothetical protein AAGG72_08815, partial [Pseudomonadota bacterium]
MRSFEVVAMDFVPLVNSVIAQTTTPSEVITPLASDGLVGAALKLLSENWQSWLVAMLVLAAVYYFVRRIGDRLFGRLEETMFSNWRLALLGTTGLVLSLASGWTTWDGMRNFTGEPALSFMITFGIQGVMLIVAWLIGESFATGMNATGTQKAVNTVEITAGALIGLFIVALTVYLVLMGKMPFGVQQLLYVALFLAVATLVVLFQADIAQPYLQSSRIIVRNAVLWVMFLSCMATSVFFSFDSLFSTIFPQQERERAAQLRAENQVSGILADIGQTVATERLNETQRLFQTEGWQSYDRQLSQLASIAQGSQADIERFFTSKIEERRAAIAEQQDRQASAESQQGALATQKVRVQDELQRAQARRPGLGAEVAQRRQAIVQINQRIDEQRAIMLAEEKGVEGSGKAGRGPRWREARGQLARIQAELQVAEERLRGPRDRLAAVDRRISTMKSELALIDGQLGKLRGEAQTAEQRIAAAERTKESDEALLQVDPARILPAFDKARIEFRQDPTRAGLISVRNQCQALLGALLSVEATKDRVAAIDCDPKTA